MKESSSQVDVLMIMTMTMGVSMMVVVVSMAMIVGVLIIIEAVLDIRLIDKLSEGLVLMMLMGMRMSMRVAMREGRVESAAHDNVADDAHHAGDNHDLRINLDSSSQKPENGLVDKEESENPNNHHA